MPPTDPPARSLERAADAARASPATRPPAPDVRRPGAARIRRGGVRLAAAAAGLLALLFLATFFHRVLDITRGSPVEVLPGATPSDAGLAPAGARFPSLLTALGEVTLVAGHDVEILVDGAATFRRIFDDMRAATLSITLQSYYCENGALLDRFAAILAERARAGVRVHVVADGFGCRDFASRHADALRAACVEFAVLRPLRWFTFHRAQHRSHVRLVVVDGRVAYTGGFGLADVWLTGDGVGWRDTNVRFEGPAVRTAQGAFIAAWAEATGALLTDEALLPHAAAATAASADTRAAVQFGGPGLGTTPFERTLALTIGGARERLYIANAYFIPSPPVRALLADAARRGVDVRLLTAGPRSDLPGTRIAARAYFGELLDAGVRIYEYLPTMMHAKTWVADGVWAGIGSMNLDNRSLRLNDELNLLLLDSAHGAALERQFHVDLEHAREIDAASHDQRPWSQRLQERVVTWVAPFL